MPGGPKGVVTVTGDRGRKEVVRRDYGRKSSRSWEKVVKGCREERS